MERSSGAELSTGDALPGPVTTWLKKSDPPSQRCHRATPARAREQGCSPVLSSQLLGMETSLQAPVPGQAVPERAGSEAGPGVPRSGSAGLEKGAEGSWPLRGAGWVEVSLPRHLHTDTCRSCRAAAGGVFGFLVKCFGFIDHRPKSIQPSAWLKTGWWHLAKTHPVSSLLAPSTSPQSVTGRFLHVSSPSCGLLVLHFISCLQQGAEKLCPAKSPSIPTPWGWPYTPGPKVPGVIPSFLQGPRYPPAMGKRCGSG